MHSDPNTGRTREKGRPPAAAILLVPLVVALVLTLFAWPTARLAPRDLPVGVAGPPAATKAMEARLSDDAFAVQRFADETAAREAIQDREVYGAFVATPRGAKVLTASAASAGVAQMLTTAAIHQEHAAGRPVPVEDVVEAGHGGPAIPSSVFPLMLAGILTGVLAGVLASGTLRRAGLVVGASILAGLAATAIVQSWLGVLGGDWAANAAAFTLIVLAISAFVAGLQAWFGEKGVIAGALTMILIGNPFSGVGAAPEMLPQPTGALGQLMPPGAGGNLLRSTGFFDGAAAGGHALVLAAWALGGLGLLLAAGLRARRVATAPAPAAA
jgi:hypothetical protein